MNVTCPGCSTVFRVDPAKVPAGGVRARCSVCRAVFRVESEPVEAPAPAPAQAAPAAAPRAPPRPEQPSRALAAAPRASDHAVASPPFVVPPPAPVRPAATTFPPPQAPAPAGRRAARPAAVLLAAGEHRHAHGAAAARRRALGEPLPVQGIRGRRRAGSPGRWCPTSSYHPEKRLEGLRHGTLKQIFEEEIKKSWEEYAGQVGRELAESTTHFNDALNEILGDGSKIF